LLELVDVDWTVFGGLKRDERELLDLYWKAHGKKPKMIRKSKIDEKMAKQDRKELKAELKRRRPRGNKIRGERTSAVELGNDDTSRPMNLASFYYPFTTGCKAGCGKVL
jgi:hypothetical protein